MGWLLALALLALEVTSVVVVLWNLVAQEPLPEGVLNHVKDRCDNTGFACTVASSIFFTVVPLLVGSFVFVFWRLARVQRPLLKDAKEQPSRLVETAGEMVGSVVGRDDVCNVLQDSLRDRNGRLPYVVVGGVGIGKTAVLVRLTELLAERGAVPVPIRLRDATEAVDFLEMAREAFLRATQSSNWLAAEAERAWGRLCRTDKIVVLADGLEEALADSKDIDVDQERDHRVRAAVSQARRREYPLVIASREHDALSALDAALLRLEPLSEEAALDYIEEDRPVDDEGRLGWIVDRADVVETPLYLQLARELHESGQLQHTTIDPRGLRRETLETRGADRVLLRMNLAQSWVDALIEGTLDKAPVALSPKERRATVLQLAALACCGLANDTLQVTFDMFEKSEPGDGPAGPRPEKGWWSRTGPVYPELKDGLKIKLKEALKKGFKRVGELSTEEVFTEEQRLLRVDMQVAASNGVRLGLVEPRGKGVRFPHSIMQAYLGSMLIGEALKDSLFRKQAFKAPGREFLIALGMFARRQEADGVVVRSKAAQRVIGQMSWRSWLSSRLRKAADSPPTDVKKLELLTAAVDVDSVDKESDHRHALDELANAWTQANSWDEASREAKITAVARVGNAARRLTEKEREEEGSAGVLHTTVGDVLSGVTALFDAVKAVDKKTADELESGLRFAYPQRERPGGDWQVPDSRLMLVRDVVEDAERALQEVERKPRPAEGDEAVKKAMADLRILVSRSPSEAFGFYTRLYKICCQEDNYEIRLAAVQEIGAGGDIAFKELKKKLSEVEPKPSDGYRDDDGRYAHTVRARLLPMLVGSADEDDDAAKLLGKWLQSVGKELPPWLEAALAEGFKDAANRRPQHPFEMAKTRAYLAARAEEMLEKANYWFSRLTLLHALCLWALSGTFPGTRDKEERRDFRAVVDRWLRRNDEKEEHPFVSEAGELVVKALETGHPERFIWIDESGIATTVGSRSKRERPHVMRTLWIPPSAGWLLLERRAQQLVADVLILLTLAERGDTNEDWAWNLGKIMSTELPLCLTQDRTQYLQPTETVGVTQRSPGDTCKGGCPVALCPYPPKGQQPYRVELSEAFCRNQRELLGGRQWPFAGGAAWQHAPRSELQRFWREMEMRART